jgi:DNA helicase HerA-like ATPase
MESSTLSLIYSSNKDYNFPFGRLVQNKSVELKIDANKFFSKHIALVGSTGSGKSCTVSKILQDVIGINQGKNSNSSNQKNSHILIFDIHSEYKSAFDLHKDEKFTLNILDVDSLKLPYWLMNSEELETIFIEGNENNHHNQVSQFKRAVILNKEKHNTSLKDKVTYDTPVYFSIEEVYNYIWNLNNEVVSKLANENCPKLSDGQLITDIEKSVYFNDKLDFVVNSTAAATKASNGAFYGEFNRFLSRLETKLSDNRLSFIIRPLKDDSSKFETKDFGDILKQFLGYIDKANISIIDLSGIPFEVLSITVSLVSRLVFDFAFHYSKLKHSIDEKNDVPFLIVCEEAHNYIPRTGGAEYKASRKSLERIAKEGRKYGLSLMVVSQRPSEVSETIFSQCNNFISLRLTNVNDQNYVKALMPENSNAIADILPNLGPGECLIVGDATIIPSVVKLDMPNPEPKSQSIRFQDEWQKDWKDASFENVIKRWKKE